jgi:oligosaccharide repeat unit polymerase
VALLPIIALLLKEIANFSRAGILLGFMEFFVSFMLMRHYFTSRSINENKIGKLNIVMVVIVVFSLMAVSASVIRFLRHPTDQMVGSTKELSTFKGGFFLSPGIYLYASSHIGVLNKHLEEEAQAKLIGNKTISPIYRFLSSFEVVRKPEYHQKGYYIPQWTNTGTYLRDLHADFSYWGVFVAPFLVGLLTTFYWFKFYETGKLKDYVILVYLYLIIGMSFLFMVTSHPAWMIVLPMILILISTLEFSVNRTKDVKLGNS